MLGIGRQDRRAALFRGIQDQIAGGNQRLLVGEHHRAPLLHRRQYRAEAGAADDRAHRPVTFQPRGLLYRLSAARDADVRAAQRVAQRRQAGFVGDHRKLRPRADRDSSQLLGIAVRRDGHHAEAIGRALDQIERGRADRAGRTENRDGLHSE